MEKIRAEPGKHRLNCFMEWSKQTITKNRHEDRAESPPQHTELTSKKTENEVRN